MKGVAPMRMIMWTVILAVAAMTAVEVLDLSSRPSVRVNSPQIEPSLVGDREDQR
jgi:hypothetical protein